MTSERCNKVFVLFVRVVQRLYDDANCIIENTVQLYYLGEAFVEIHI